MKRHKKQTEYELTASDGWLWYPEIRKWSKEPLDGFGTEERYCQTKRQAISRATGANNDGVEFVWVQPIVAREYARKRVSRHPDIYKAAALGIISKESARKMIRQRESGHSVSVESPVEIEFERAEDRATYLNWYKSA